MKRDDLIYAAKELNEVLGLEPPIETGDAVKTEALKAMLKEAIELIVPEEDEFSERTCLVLEAFAQGEKEEAAISEIRTSEPLSPVEKTAEKSPAPAPKKKISKKSKKKKQRTTVYTRFHSIAEAIQQNKELSDAAEIIDLADKLYNKKTGKKQNRAQSKLAYYRAISVLRAFGISMDDLKEDEK